MLRSVCASWRAQGGVPRHHALFECSGIDETMTLIAAWSVLPATTPGAGSETRHVTSGIDGRAAGAIAVS